MVAAPRQTICSWPPARGLAAQVWETPVLGILGTPPPIAGCSPSPDRVLQSPCRPRNREKGGAVRPALSRP